MSEFDIIVLDTSHEQEYVARKRYVGNLVRDGWIVINSWLVSAPGDPAVFAVAMIGRGVPALFPEEELLEAEG